MLQSKLVLLCLLHVLLSMTVRSVGHWPDKCVKASALLLYPLLLLMALNAKLCNALLLVLRIRLQLPWVCQLPHPMQQPRLVHLLQQLLQLLTPHLLLLPLAQSQWLQQQLV